MNRIFKIFVIIVLSTLSSNISLAQKSFYQDRERGWYYRECIECKKNDTAIKKSNSNDTLRSMSAEQVLGTLNSVQKEMQVRQARYVLEPTPENAHDFLSYQRLMFKNASKASESMQTALIKHPYLDSRLEDPVSQQALGIKNKEEKIQNDVKIREFAQNFTLLYFFKDGCPYCQEFQPVLERVVKDYQFKIEAVSNDFSKNSIFRSRVDKNLSQKLDIEFYPTVVAFNQANNIYLPISRGYLPEDELKHNILHVYDHIVALAMEVK